MQSLSFTSEDGDRQVVLRWTPRPGGENVDWEILFRDTKEFEELVSLGTGDILTSDPSKRFVRLLSLLVPQFPHRVLRPKGKLVATVFGWTLALATLSLLRLIGVAIPPSAWDDGNLPPVSSVVDTVQQLTRTLTLSDLPMLVVGSFVNSPVIGLLIVAAAGFSFLMYSLPQIGTSRDLLGGRAIAVYMFAVVPAACAVAIAPWPTNLLIVALAIACATSQLVVGTIPWQLHRWMQLSRRVVATGLEDWPAVRTREPAPYETLGDGAALVHQRAVTIQKKIWKKRDKALTAVVQRAYQEGRQLRIDLAFDLRAAIRGRAAPSARILVAKIANTLPFWLRSTIFQAWQGLILLGLVVLMLTPEPWIAPSCISGPDGESTVYLLADSDQPTYLDGDRRSVIQASSWDGLELSAGACRP